jgi:hypothetical protein
MNKHRGISLPHPVIGNGTDVKGSFELKISANIENDNLVLTQDGDIAFYNDYFKKLYEEKKIITSHKITSSGTLYAELFNGKLEKVINTNLLSWNVEIETYLIAADEILDYGDDTFNEDFLVEDPNRKFSVEKGMIVGFGGTTTLIFDTIYLTSLSGIIEFFPIAIDQPISFDTDGPKIIIKYPKKVGSIDIVSVLSHKTSKFKETFLGLFIIPALSAAYDALKKAEEENNYALFVEQHNWASIIHTLGPEWEGKNSFVLAQQFLKLMIERKYNKPSLIPIISSFEELQKFMN